MNDEGLTLEYRARIYVGKSRRGDSDFSLSAAIRDGYEQATADGKRPPFRVLEIWVDGDNPLSEYRAAIGSGS